MKILGLDTATPATAVAVLDTESGGVHERRDDPPPGTRPRHTTRLLALAAQALGDASIQWSDLDRIAVGVGPGTFTGIRIGVATARALASARALGIVGVSTLSALAAAAELECAQTGEPAMTVAVIDARRSEVFAAADPVLAPSALSPHRLADALGAGRWRAVGDGALVYRDVLEADGIEVPAANSPLHRVQAGWTCRLAMHAAARTPGEIHPDYLREPDARIPQRTPGALR